MYSFNPIKDLSNVLFSPKCVVCGRSLLGEEHDVCVECMGNLPLSGYASVIDNPLELQLNGVVPHLRAMSFMMFQKGGASQRIVHAIKYHGNTRLGVQFGRLLGEALSASHRFDDVDVICPVPLHFLRKVMRGFNQSYIISSGITETFNRPVVSGCIYRTRYTTTQTQQDHISRLANVKGAFKVLSKRRLEGKHILLIDDVITTGATVAACCEALSSVGNIKISVASLTSVV